ncbi:CIA30 family protein [Luteimonas lutimaris]|uniref:Amidohydrolase family protein n=1 Tax=Luteimonas lutimaris TaxID=698645 RepID=A0ABP7N3E9_9GAMM
MKSWPELTAAATLVAALTAAVLVQERPAPQQPSSTTAAEPAPRDNSFAIRDVRVFDGERAIERANVVVRDGRIAAVGADARIPEGLDVVDGAGKTLLPGLVDAHVHSWGNARSDALRFGVTTELDMLGDWNRLPQIEQQRGSLAGTSRADLWSAGAAVTAPGGHGTQYGMDVPTLAADGDAGAFVDARVAEGSDYIKIIVEDLGAYGTGMRMPTLAPAQVAAAIDAAHRNDRLAVVHVSGRAPAMQAVEAGADGLAHIFIDAPVDEAFAKAARSHDSFVIPTLSVLMGIAGSGEGARLADDPRLQPWLGNEQVATLEASFPLHARDPALAERLLASVAALHAAGVTILAGTDAGNPGTTHGASMHGELELLVRAGLSPAEALNAATAATARAFGLDDRGRITPGLRADLLLVEGNPLADITATRAIDTVWKNGHAVERVAASAAAPAASALDETLLADFDGDAIDAGVGMWQSTTDAIAGGASVASHDLVAGGADGSSGALAVRGEIRPGFAYPWAGAIVFPGGEAMPALDFTARTELVFKVRGDGRRYSAMLFSGPSMQGMPSMQAFTAGEEWSEVRLPLDGFAGADLAQLRAIAFAAGKPAGEFEFFLDHVELR